ncbi:MAG: hypothetical protein KJI69_05495 [Patescibacteria group bacterium]|nr:hypothetical protein [Patescibacteria group bacterium]
MKGFKDKNKKFHPISQSKRVRSRRDTKNQGVIMKKRIVQFSEMSDKQMEKLGRKESVPRLKRKLVLMRNPKTQDDKNHILSSVLGSNRQFKKEAGETEAELWFTAQVQLKSRGWKGKVNRKEFDKWLALERQKRYKRVTGEEFAQFFRDQKSEEITNEVKNKWSNVIVKESMDKISKGYTLQVLDQLTNNFQLELENVDYDYIKKERGFGGILQELTEIKKRDLDSALFFLEEKFGYGEPDRRPENKGQEIAQKLLEPFERMKDEQLAKLKNREVDFVKSKKIIQDVVDDLYADAKESLRDNL